MLAIILSTALVASAVPSARAQIPSTEELAEDATESVTPAPSESPDSGTIEDDGTSSEGEEGAEAGSKTKVRQQPAQPGQRGREIAAMRTRTSRTFASEQGSYITEAFPGSVHYRDDRGAWKPIDNDLAPSGRAEWALENRANRYRLLLPHTLGAAPVRFERGRDWASFSLDNAKGSAQAQANRASYEEALHGVDVDYEALNDLVRERLILKAADAQNSFIWTLRTSSTVEPRLTSAGGVDFVTASGEVRFHISPPEIFDSAEPEEEFAPKHSYSLENTAGGYQLSLKVDQQWLSEPNRIFPVVVDPPVAIGRRDCWIEDGDRSNLSHCAGQQIRVGNNGSYKRRALVEFDLAEFPDNAQVLNARFGAYLLKTNTTGAAQVDLRRIKQYWDEDATWDSRTAGAVWRDDQGNLSPGGSFGQPGYDNLSVGAGEGWKYWYPTELVNQAISKGGTYNDGVLLKLADESVAQTFYFASFDNTDQSIHPKLEVEWDFGGMGQLKNYTQESRRVSDRTNLKANVAGGNLMIHETDSIVRGINNHDLKIERYYNSLVQAEHAPLRQAAGEGWTVSPSADTRLLLYTETQSNGEEEVVGAALAGRSGYRVPFTKNPSTGKFKSPAGLSADLRHLPEEGEYRVQFRGDKERLFFGEASGLLVRHEDKNGNAISFGYQDGLLTTIVDTQGRETTLTYDTYTVNPGTSEEETRQRLRSIVEPVTEGAREHLYDYEPENPHLLTTYTAPDGAVTTYGYNTSRDLLTSITKQMGDGKQHEWRFAYSADADTLRFVTKMAEVTGSGDENATTFYYDAANTDRCTTLIDTEEQHADVTLATRVLDARGQDLTGDARDARKTFYCYDDLSRVEIVVDGDGNLTRLDYTADANIEYHRNARGAEFLYSYDQTGENLIGSQGPADGDATSGSTTKVEYQDDRHPHFPTLIRDAEGHDKRISYDGEGNVVEVIEGADTSNPVTFRYEYDGRGNLTRIRRPEGDRIPDADEAQGNDTLLTYYPDAAPPGSAHMLETIDHPGELGDVSYTYDTLSRVLDENDGKGQNTAFTYDLRDRVDVVNYADGSMLDYDYDLVGNAVSRSDSEPDGSAETETYDYNARNLLVSETRRRGSDAEYAVSYDYNKMRSLNLVEGPTSKTTYRYNNLELADRLRTWDGSGADLSNERTIDFSYNPLYDRKRIDLPGGGMIERTYYTSGKLKKVMATNNSSTSPFRDLKYDYADEGSQQRGKLQKRTNLRNEQETTYSYDGLGRLTAEETENSDSSLDRRFSFSYDPNSNLTCKIVNDGDGGISRSNLRYDPANQLTHSFEASSCGADTPADATTYSYDANGNLAASSAGFEANHDARDHTTSLKPDQDSPQVTFDYSGPTQGERVGKSHSPDDATDKEVTYTHDLLGLASESETTETADLLATDTVTTNYIRDPSGEVLGYSQGAKNRFFVRDLTGTVVDITNNGGNRMSWYDYSPYGELLGAGDGTEFLSFRFAQGYFDEETGLQKHGVRYYGMGVARFTQVDPVFGKTTDPITLNAYQYANCDPVNSVDPTGRSAFDCAMGIWGVVGGAADVLGGFGIILTSVMTAPHTWGQSLYLAVAATGVITYGAYSFQTGVYAISQEC